MLTTSKPVPAVVLRQQFVAAPEELFAFLRSSVPWDERLRARKTASFGESYDYSGMTYPKVSMLAELEPVCQQIQSTLGFMPNNCLLNYYPDGQSSMGFHSDATEELAAGSGVAIVSLGAQRQLVFRNKLDRLHEVSYSLPSGSLLYMPRELQFEWLHAIPKAPDSGPRISLTFRRLERAAIG